MRQSVLLVEDDLDLAKTIIDYLELENISCDYAANGLTGLQLIKQNAYNVVVLDINMPRMDGLSMCQEMREMGLDTPIIMLTARDTLNDKLAGFSAGADDYLVKPFEMQELVARIQALSNRRSGQTNKLRIHDLKADFGKKQAFRNHSELKLSPTGWIILELLMRKSPKAVSRQSLTQAIWGDDQPDSNSLKVHVFKLRQQVDGSNENKLIHTISGQGIALRGETDNLERE